MSHCRPSGIQIVLFDAVGTLIYPDPPVAQVYFDAGSRHGSKLAQPQIAERFRAVFAGACDEQATSEERERSRWRDIVSQVFSDVSGEQEALFEELWQHFARAKHWSVFADVAPAWQSLMTAGVRIGIASNFDQRLVGICRQLSPLDTAEHVFQSAALGYSKPHPAFFQAIQQRLDIPPQAIFMVGDSQENDIAPAQAAGWAAVRVDRQSESAHANVIHSLTRISI